MHESSTFAQDSPRCDPKIGQDGKLIHEKYFKSCAKNNETWKKKFLFDLLKYTKQD